MTTEKCDKDLSQKSNDSSSWRTIRVFISSTFSDMQPERNHLVKVVFPELRKLCESRGVTWGEVDLRWGVTDEEKAEGKVLPICLAEIHRCRPYFIGILGERYGWIPHGFPEDLLDREPWLEEQLHERKSVTELEILHGVLRNASMYGHAYFYFRDSKYADDFPPEYRAVIQSEDAYSATKLFNLKEHIRTARNQNICCLRENFANVVQLGNWVREDFTNLINMLFPEDSPPNPLDRESMEHENCALRHRNSYCERKDYFKELDSHAEAVTETPFVVLGESGSGKTALLANWFKHYREKRKGALTFQHYIGSTPYSTDWSAMLRRIMGELKRTFHIEDNIPENLDELRNVFPNWLFMAAASGRFILLLDGLDQLENVDGAQDLSWLPPVIPKHIRLIISMKPGQVLNEVQKRKWPLGITVNPLDSEERKSIIIGYFSNCAKHLKPQHIEMISVADQTSSPLYLRIFLDELRVLGLHEHLDERIHYYLDAKNTIELYKKVLQRWEGDYESNRQDLVADAMTALWAARRGLSEAELMEILGSKEEPLPRAYWSPLFITAESMIASGQGVLRFAHQYARDAVEANYLKSVSQKAAAHQRLAAYFWKEDISARVIDELPFQLAEANNKTALAELYAQPERFSVFFRSKRAETKKYWRYLEEGLTYRIPEVYKNVIEQPSLYFSSAIDVADLLDETEHFNESEELLKSLITAYMDKANREGESLCRNRLGLLQMEKHLYDEALEQYDKCRILGEQLSRDDIIATAFLNKSIILKKQDRYEEALATLEEGMPWLNRQQDYATRCNALIQKAEIFACLGNASEASRLLNISSRDARITNDDDILSHALVSQAAFLSESGNMDAMENIIKELEALCRHNGDIRRLAECLNQKGILYLLKGRYKEGLDFQRESASGYQALGIRQCLAASLGNQAEVLIHMGHLQEARPLNEESILIYREYGMQKDLAISLINQGVIERTDGVFDKAFECAQEAENIARAIGDRAILGRALCLLGNVAEEKKHFNDAEEFYTKAIMSFKNGGSERGLVAAYINRGTFLAQEIGEPLQALEDFNTAYELASKYAYTKMALDTLRLVTTHYAGIGYPEIALTAAEEWSVVAARNEKLEDRLTADIYRVELMNVLGESKNAYCIATAILDDVQRLDIKPMLPCALMLMGTTERANDDSETALKFMKKAQTLFEDMHEWGMLIHCVVGQARILLYDMNLKEEGEHMLDLATAIAIQHNLPEELKAITIVRGQSDEEKDHGAV